MGYWRPAICHNLRVFAGVHTTGYSSWDTGEPMLTRLLRTIPRGVIVKVIVAGVAYLIHRENVAVKYAYMSPSKYQDVLSGSGGLRSNMKEELVTSTCTSWLQPEITITLFASAWLRPSKKCIKEELHRMADRLEM